MKNYVLITGATSGIGYELTNIFAENKYNVIITGRNNEKLIKMKEDLMNKYNINIYTFDKDLSKKNSAIELYMKL